MVVFYEGFFFVCLLNKRVKTRIFHKKETFILIGSKKILKLTKNINNGTINSFSLWVLYILSLLVILNGIENPFSVV